MKKGYFIFLLLITLTLTACMQYESYIYEGESKHWKGKYEVFSNDGEMYTYKLTLQYKRNASELAHTEKITFSFKKSRQSAIETMEYEIGDDPKKGAYMNVWSSSTGNWFTEETISTVTIEWDGLEEIIELQNQD